MRAHRWIAGGAPWEPAGSAPSGSLVVAGRRPGGIWCWVVVIRIWGRTVEDAKAGRRRARASPKSLCPGPPAPGGHRALPHRQLRTGGWGAEAVTQARYRFRQDIGEYENLGLFGSSSQPANFHSPCSPGDGGGIGLPVNASGAASTGRPLSAAAGFLPRTATSGPGLRSRCGAPGPGQPHRRPPQGAGPRRGSSREDTVGMDR